jgi:hypothetical protein
MSEAVEPRKSYAPAEPGLLDEVERRLMLIGGQKQGKGEILKDFPVEHVFTPGLYSRIITMPAGAMLTSGIHKTEHPFVVARGRCSVYIEGQGFVLLEAPHMGITMPGTRRMLVIHEETVWITFHPTTETDLLKIEKALLEEHENLLWKEVEETPKVEAGT